MGPLNITQIRELRRLAVVGPGLIGHSITLAARRAQPEISIAEIDRGQSLDAAAGADLIVLATPVDLTIRLLHTHADLLQSTVTLDTGSIKAPVVRAAEKLGLTSFVGSHPMSGAATSGPAAAREDLFDTRPWFLVPHTAATPAVQRARVFVESLRATPVILEDDGTEHDRVMAAVSHLPQVVASVLIEVVAIAAGERLAWAGTGLRETTRLADSSASVWQSIFAANATNLRPLLFTLADQLTHIAQQLDDPRAVQHLFDRAHQARSQLK